MRNWSRFAFLALFCISACLAFARLGDAYFWDDEAHVAILARNYAASGNWTAWDGRTLLPDHNAVGVGNDLQMHMIQLDAACVAAVFHWLSPSTWSARLPFVLAGLIVLVVFYFAIRRDFKGEQALQLYIFACLALSTNFLLYIRNCRYYALAMLFSLLTWTCYRRYLSERRVLDPLFLAMFAILLALSSILVAGAFLAALLVTHLLLQRRDFAARDWGRMGVAALVFLIGIVPYIVASQVWKFDYTAIGFAADPWYLRKPTLLWWNLRDVSLAGYLPWSFVLASLFLLASPRKAKSDPPPENRSSAFKTALLPEHLSLPGHLSALQAWLHLSLIYVVVLALLSPQLPTIPSTNIADLRYLAPALPFFAVPCGFVLWAIHRYSPTAAIGLLALFLSFNVLGALPSPPPDFKQSGIAWLLPAYIREVHQLYPTAYSEVMEYLHQHAHRDDTFFAQPDHVNKPLAFYLGNYLRLSCILDRKTPLSKAALRSMHAPLLIEENFPQWFLAFGAQPGISRYLNYFSRPHPYHGQIVQYQYRDVTTLDVYWNQTQRPELPWHSFGPKRGFDREGEGVHVFQRIGPFAVAPPNAGKKRLTYRKIYLP